ncbi:hypothetical protein ACQ4PT_022651 [Festuca glaucescens]
MGPRRRPRRRNGSAGNGAKEADVPTHSGEGDGGSASDAEGRAACRRPGLEVEAGVAVVEAAAANTNRVAPFVGDDGGAVSEAEGGAAGRMPGPGLEDGLAVVEAATAGTSKVAPFFGDDGGGVSEAEGRAAGCRPGLEPGVDVVDTNKVAPFVRGQDDEGASQVDGSFTGRREARGGVMAPALDLSTNKMEPFSSSDAVGDTSGSGGGSYARRCDDRVTPSFDPQLPNATQRTVTVLENRSAVTEDFTSKQQATSMSPGSSMPESMGKLSPITEIILSWKLKDIMDDNLYRDKSIFQLHAMKTKSIDVLVVDDAGQLKESDLIVPLCLSLKHVLLFGDFCTSPPMVKSKVCYEAGFHTSLFQRLLKSKNIPRIKLDKQFAIEPNLFKFVNNRFYGWEDVDKKLHIAIVCFPSSPLYAMKDGLLSKYAGYKKIKLSVMYVDSIDGERYDVVIISAFFKNGDQIDLKDMTAAITRARHCFWFLGDLSACPGTLGELIDDARGRNYLMKLDPKKLQMVNDLGGFPSSHNDSLMVTQIFKVKSCSKLEIKEAEDMGSALISLAAGNVYVGTYRVSRNYFSLKPGEVYHYDRTIPYLNPRSSLPYAHAVMMIGSGTELTKLSNQGRKVHLNFQNSSGNLFGDNGFGKVGSSSVRSLHRITV